MPTRNIEPWTKLPVSQSPENGFPIASIASAIYCEACRTLVHAVCLLITQRSSRSTTYAYCVYTRRRAIVREPGSNTRVIPRVTRAFASRLAGARSPMSGHDALLNVTYVRTKSVSLVFICLENFLFPNNFNICLRTFGKKCELIVKFDHKSCFLCDSPKKI